MKSPSSRDRRFDRQERDPEEDANPFATEEQTVHNVDAVVYPDPGAIASSVSGAPGRKGEDRSGRPTDVSASVRDQMRQAGQAVFAPRDEELEWRSGVNLPAGNFDEVERTPPESFAGYAVAGSEEQTMLGEALQAPSYEPVAKPQDERGERPARQPGSRQTGRLPVRTTGRFKTMGEAPPNEATPIAASAPTAPRTTGRLKTVGEAPPNDATPIATAAPAVSARTSGRFQTVDQRPFVVASAGGQRSDPSDVPAEDETLMLDEVPPARRPSVTGRRRAVSVSRESAVAPEASDGTDSAASSRAGAFSREAGSEQPRPSAATAEVPKVDPQLRRRLKIAGGVIGGFFGLLLIFELATSVEKPSSFELGVLYPYGSAGAVGRRGERAPGLAQVEFEYQGRKPCSATPDAETCLLYEYTSSSGFRGSMLVRKTPLGSWERASDEGMPFQPARR